MMTSANSSTQRIFLDRVDMVHRSTDRLFVWLLTAEWLFGILLAVTLSPSTWVGRYAFPHPHLLLALLMGPILNVPPLLLIRLAPGWWATRHAVAISQTLWSAVFIHLTGGRIETHFHIFGSLAFLAFYRDWKVLVTATAVVAADHLLRGFYWPESVYGIANPEWWRFLEHAAWVVFEDIVLVLGCLRGLEELRLIARREGELEATNADVERLVATRTAELAASVERFRTLVEGTNAIPFEVDVANGRWAYLAPQASRMFGRSAAQLTAGTLQDSEFVRLIAPQDRERVSQFFADFIAAGSSGSGATQAETEVRYLVDGRIIDGRTILSALRPGEPMRGIILDISQQKQLEADLRQAQKLESVGRLASGVAHEINTPIQFVSDSVHFVREVMGGLLPVFESYRVLQDAAAIAGEPVRKAAAEAAAAEETADLAYTLENAPKALDRAVEGLDRVATIVRSMKEFAHPDQSEQAPADLNQAIRTTLTLARNEYKYVADVETDLGELPPITCLIGELNQVILNLVVNAAHAIADVIHGTEARGTITVRTRQDGDWVEVAVADTGSGIPEEIRERVFDPFFTTKEVGKGTGQGLAIARSVVVDKHGGRLRFESELGRGTTFFMRLPVEGRSHVEAAPQEAA